MFTVFVGPVGSGKTFSLTREAKIAFEKGEPIFANFDIDVSHWNSKNGGTFHRWRRPMELTDEKIKCGTVLFDELGAAVNNKEHDFFPLELVIKLIEHRKDHLDFFATVQDDELADKNVRRFYNRVKFVSEHRLPFVGLIWPSSRRTDLKCPNPDCHKGGCLIKGDKQGFPWWGTWYNQYDVNPQDTRNKYKHRSLGTERILWDFSIAAAYSSAQKVASDALEGHKEMIKITAYKNKKPFWKKVNKG
jgi:hypothetical protein